MSRIIAPSWLSKSLATGFMSHSLPSAWASACRPPDDKTKLHMLAMTGNCLLPVKPNWRTLYILCTVQSIVSIKTPWTTAHQKALGNGIRWAKADDVAYRSSAASFHTAGLCASLPRTSSHSADDQATTPAGMSSNHNEHFLTGHHALRSSPPLRFRSHACFSTRRCRCHARNCFAQPTGAQYANTDCSSICGVSSASTRGVVRRWISVPSDIPGSLSPPTL